MRFIYFLPVLLLSVFCFIFNSCNNREVQKGFINDSDLLLELMPDPPAEYRSAPLWDWNDSITEEGIAFQMNEFKKAGIGGVFVHPRPGLITEYLSDNWNQLFDFTVKTARELGMHVWIYDENSYPSGFAGGHVPAEMPDSYQNGTGLSMEVQEIFEPGNDESYEVILKDNEGNFINITSDFKNEIGKHGKYYLFKRT